MGLRYSRTRWCGRWSLWLFTAALFVMTVASFTIQPGVQIQRGTHEFGTAHSVQFSGGVMIYQRVIYMNHVYYASPPVTPQPTHWWGLRWKTALSNTQNFQMNSVHPSALRRFFPSRPHQSAFSVPLVSMLILFLMFSRIVLLSDRRRGRELVGCCGGCGYSLAGLDGGACPECGEGTK